MREYRREKGITRGWVVDGVRVGKGKGVITGTMKTNRLPVKSVREHREVCGRQQTGIMLQPYAG